MTITINNFINPRQQLYSVSVIRERKKTQTYKVLVTKNNDQNKIRTRLIIIENFKNVILHINT